MRGIELKGLYNTNINIRPPLLSGIMEEGIHPAGIDYTTHFTYLSVIAVLTVALAIALVRLTTVIKEKKYKQAHESKLNDALSKAELDMLKSELDPHFMYNSLSCLSHVIQTDTSKALEFNARLAKTYKYFLVNKRRTYVSLTDEIDFIKDYFALLQVRHDNAIQLHIGINPAKFNDVLILPCALQLLVENAVKHNTFSEKDPLLISITMNDAFISVTNQRRASKIVSYSTRKGLANLKARYQLVCNQMIAVENTADLFIVKLPLVKSA